MKTIDFLPIYALETVITFISGVMSSAISNHLIRELHYKPWVASIVAAMFFIGFFISTMTIGHISDKYGQKKVIRMILSVKIAFNTLYLIPITSDISLILFAIVFFFDGSFVGMFWPSVQQISVLAEKKGGLLLKNKFMSGYHLGWNLGYLLGMIFGTITVYFTESNYNCFILGLIGSVIGCIVAWTKIQKPLYELGKIDLDSLDSNKNNTLNPEKLDQPNSETGIRFKHLPFYCILMAMLTHSLIEGSLVIILPIKVGSSADFWIFLLMVFKLVTQTLSTTRSAYISEKRLIRTLIYALFTLFLVWFLLIFSESLWSIAIIMTISGFVQGIIYALNMKLTSYKAREMNSSKPFSYFQSMMSAGRMIGPPIIGFGALISISLGISILVAYDLMTWIVFLLNIRKESLWKQD